jgi:hydroxymethylpyrimidine pyrophosphatase-like HAD family hydrolase
VVRDDAMPPATAQGVIRALREALPGITFGCEVGGRFGCEPRYEALRPYARQQGVWRADALALAEYPLTKLMALYPALSSDALLAEVQATVGAVVACTHSGLPLVEISAAGVDKGSGVTALAEQLGIDMAAVIACGDMPNDLPMLRRAGLGVAVANAHPDVLAAADAVTAAADSDGLAAVLERVLAARQG